VGGSLYQFLQKLRAVAPVGGMSNKMSKKGWLAVVQVNFGGIGECVLQKPVHTDVSLQQRHRSVRSIRQLLAPFCTGRFFGWILQITSIKKIFSPALHLRKKIRNYC